MIDPPRPPTLELGHVRLRPLRAADAPTLYAYLSVPVVTELTSYPVVTPALAHTIITKANTRWAAGELAKWGIAQVSDDQLIGTCGFTDGSPSHRWAELAYDLAPAYWGQGLMRQVVATVLTWTFRTQPIARIQAYVRVDNRRSARLLEHCGFAHEGCLRAYRLCRGQPYAFNVYGLLRAEWDTWASHTARPRSTTTNQATGV